MRVREVMNGAVLSVTPETPVAETRRLMQRERIRHVLVLDGGRLTGIVTDRDIRLTLPSPATTLSVWEMNDLLMKLTAAEIMTSPVITIAPDREVHEAAQIMIDHKIGALPVLEGGRLIGIVTETDLLRALVLLRARALPAGTARG